MKEKIEKEIERILGVMSKTNEHAKLRELSLTVESLVMSVNRLK